MINRNRKQQTQSHNMQSIRTPDCWLNASASRSFAQFGGTLGWYSRPTQLPKEARRISPSRLPLCIRTCVDLKHVVHIHKLRCGDRPHYYFTDTDGDIQHMA